MTSTPTQEGTLEAPGGHGREGSSHGVQETSQGGRLCDDQWSGRKWEKGCPVQKGTGRLLT